MYSKMQLKNSSEKWNIFYRTEGFQQSSKKQEGVNFAHQTNKHQRIDFLQINQTELEFVHPVSAGGSVKFLPAV